LCIGSLVGCNAEPQQTVFTGYVEAELVNCCPLKQEWIEDMHGKQAKAININSTRGLHWTINNKAPQYKSLKAD